MISPRRPRDDRGSAAVELTLAVPALVIMLALLVAGGRLWFARASVTESAYAAARAGSLSRTAGQAGGDGERAAARSLDTAGLRCSTRRSTSTPAVSESPSEVRPRLRATVTCSVPFADLVLPGMPGSITLRASGQSALDTYRGRT